MFSARLRRLWRGQHVRRPSSVCRFYAGDILELQSADFVPELRLYTVAGVDDDDTAWQARLTGPFDLLQRDLWFCLEFYVFGHTRFLSPRRVVGPGLRQVQSIGDGQTHVIVGDRQRNCYLAIILFAELSAILPRDTDGVLALFWENPCRRRSMSKWRRAPQYSVSHVHGYAPSRRRPTTRPGRRNAVATGAALRFAPAPSTPLWARRS